MNVRAFGRAWALPSGWNVGLVVLGASFGIAQGVLRIVSHGPRDPIGIGFISLYIVMFGLSALSMWWRMRAVKAAKGVTVSFELDGIRVTDGKRNAPPARSYALRRIASVRQLPEAIVIVPKGEAAIVLPRRVLASDGADVMHFFRDRLVGKRMLQWPTASTTIVNTATS